MHSRKMIENLATPSDLDQRGRAEIAESVNLLLADVFALYFKTKNFHWHVSGPHFRDYHQLFDEQAAQIFTMTDVLAERVRKLGFPTLHSTGEVSRLQRIKDDNAEFLKPREMLFSLLHDNQFHAKEIRQSHAICEKYGDVATCSILEVFLDETERRIWFLFESLKHE